MVTSDERLRPREWLNMIARQPVHTVYGGAHLFKADTARRLGERAARRARRAWPRPGDFAAASGLEVDAALARTHPRTSRLGSFSREPVEDFRIDFEDGYGNRPDAEEDGHALAAAQEVARGLASGRFRPTSASASNRSVGELRERAVRTLDRLRVDARRRCRRACPPIFVVTLPKITAVAQVSMLADRLRTSNGT